MGLFDIFRNKRVAKDVEAPSAIEYVEWLFNVLVRAAVTEITIDTSKPLLGAERLPEGFEPPPCLPDPHAVINRLKLLSKVTPVQHAAAVRGSFEQPRKYHSLFVDAVFQDSAAKSTCTMRLRIRGWGA